MKIVVGLAQILAANIYFSGARSRKYSIGFPVLISLGTFILVSACVPKVYNTTRTESKIQEALGSCDTLSDERVPSCMKNYLLNYKANDVYKEINKSCESVIKRCALTYVTSTKTIFGGDTYENLTSWQITIIGNNYTGNLSELEMIAKRLSSRTKIGG